MDSPLFSRRSAATAPEPAEATARSFLLPEPKSGAPHGYMLVGSCLQEVNRFKQKFSCWLVGDKFCPGQCNQPTGCRCLPPLFFLLSLPTLLGDDGKNPCLAAPVPPTLRAPHNTLRGGDFADGTLHVSTPVDPLFVLLPVLDKNRNATADAPAGVFTGLEQLLSHDAFPHLAQILAAAVEPQLSCVCDVKEAGGERYYRLSDQRALAWLCCKLDQAAAALQPQLTGMDAGAQQSYLVGFLSEYLTPGWADRLAKHLGVEASGVAGARGTGAAGPAAGPPPPLPADEQPTDKKAKLDPKELAKRRAAEKAAETKAANMAKLAAGTKKITGFFTARAAPPPAAAKQ